MAEGLIAFFSFIIVACVVVFVAIIAVLGLLIVAGTIASPLVWLWSKFF